MLANTIISFPGLGIDGFSVDNVAFRIGEDFPVYWYGVIIMLGIVTAFAYAAYRCFFEKTKVDDLIDVALWTVILGVIGARLYYVLTSLDRYIPDPFDFGVFIKNVFNLRGGGLAIYGGIICGILGIVIATKIKKMNTIKLMDMAGPGVMIAQAIGRWGNFFNGEAFGDVVAEGHLLYFLRMGLISSNSVDKFNTVDMVYVHPTFLYESLWNVLGFILINIFYKKKKFNGQIACMYLAWYGFGRMFIEGLRMDSLYVGSFRISQVVGAACFAVFGALLVIGLVYSRKYEDPDAKLNKIDAILKPDVEQNPVFFVKKEKAQAKVEDDEGESKDGSDN